MKKVITRSAIFNDEAQVNNLCRRNGLAGEGCDQAWHWIWKNNKFYSSKWIIGWVLEFDKEIVGLGEIISGSEQFNDAIFKVPGTELDIITSGEKRFDMSDIVNKEQIKKFLDVLKLEYDYVIIDSPPVQPVSDTLILTQASDYNFFVIRSEETKTSSFMSSIKKVQNVGAKIDGIIINDLDTSKDSYYSYYYNYTADYYNKN